jgi:hypothetical protein
MKKTRYAGAPELALGWARATNTVPATARNRLHALRGARLVPDFRTDKSPLTAETVANFVIAACCTEKVQDAGWIVPRIHCLELAESLGKLTGFAAELAEMKFGDALQAVLERASAPGKRLAVSLSFEVFPQEAAVLTLAERGGEPVALCYAGLSRAMVESVPLRRQVELDGELIGRMARFIGAEADEAAA